MTRSRLRGVALVLATLGVGAGATAHAQEGTKAEVRGTIVDASGLVLPGVTVTAVHAETSETRTTVTGDTGMYRLASLALGTHTITAQLDGFNTVRQAGVTLRIGQALTMDFKLEVGGLSETINVVGGAAMIMTTKAEISSALAPEQIQNLPVMGRHWMELGLLMPGVSTTALSGRGIATGRGSDRDQSIYIDGADSRNECCSRSSGSHSQDAIAEFRVVSNNYSAEFGRSTSFVMTAVTKSGSNALHGTGFSFFRDEKLDAANVFTQKKEPYSFGQYGATVGGPVKKDRLFFFGSYERQFEGGSAFSTTGLPALDEFVVDANNTQNYALGKLDWLLSNSQRLSSKFYYWNSDDRWGRTSSFRIGGSVTPWAALDEYLHNYGTVVNHTWTGGKAVNEVYFGYIWTDWTQHIYKGVPIKGGFTNADIYIPFISAPSFTLGGRNNLPQEGFEYKFEIKDSYSRVADWHGSHELKIGGGIIIGQNDLAWFDLGRGQVTFRGDPTDPFNFDTYPEPVRFQQKLYRPGANASCPDSYRFEFTKAEIERLNSCAPYLPVPLQVYSAYVQDNWRIGPKVTFNAGLRYDLEAGSRVTNYIEKYQPQLDPQIPHPTKSDLNNLAPRVSLSYSLNEAGTTVLRAGGGVFFGASVLNRALNKLVSDGWGAITADQAFPTRQPCFQGHTVHEAITQNPKLLLPGCGSLTFDQMYAGGRKTIFAIDPDIEENRAVHAGAGFAHALTDDIGLEVDYVFQRQGPYLGNRDTNLFLDPATGGPRDPALFGRPDPRFAEINTISDFAKYRRHAIQLRLNKRLKHRYQFQLSYTGAHDNDTPSTEFAGGQLTNPFITDEWGPPNGSQVHRVTVNGSVDLPGGVQVSGILLSYSGFAYDDLVSGDPFNLGRGSTRALRDANGVIEYIPRNSNRADPYAKLDVRATKWFSGANADRKIGLIVEAFNILNKKNYGSYGNVRGTRTYRQPQNVLTSPFQARQVQLGVRVAF
jgi:hypothetical protein